MFIGKIGGIDFIFAQNPQEVQTSGNTTSSTGQNTASASDAFVSSNPPIHLPFGEQ